MTVVNNNADRTYIIAEVSKITGRGTAVFFENDPSIILPLGTRTVVVNTPYGQRIETKASIESARKARPGEVLAMLFFDLAPSEIPAGSTVSIVDL